jgi:hypothetical protein
MLSDQQRMILCQRHTLRAAQFCEHTMEKGGRSTSIRAAFMGKKRFTCRIWDLLTPESPTHKKHVDIASVPWATSASTFRHALIRPTKELQQNPFFHVLHLPNRRCERAGEVIICIRPLAETLELLLKLAFRLWRPSRSSPSSPPSPSRPTPGTRSPPAGRVVLSSPRVPLVPNLMCTTSRYVLNRLLSVLCRGLDRTGTLL